VRSVIQRVRSARVTVGDRVVGSIGHGLLALVGVEGGDTAADVEYIAAKIRDIRIFEDDGDETGPAFARDETTGELRRGPAEAAPSPAGRGGGRKRMNRSVVDVGGSVLVVSQFTLSGDVRGGRRPSFIDAAPPDIARRLYEEVVASLRAGGLTVETGEFQAMMVVALENDGPVTILVDSRKRF
jgi:D-tyrosyl-tRNA(Tyr) deacylase